MKARDLLIYLSIKYHGVWNDIYNAIVSKEKADFNEATLIVSNLSSSVVTIIDENYPRVLKESNKPPFVLFYYGDLSLISDYTRCLAVVGSRYPSEYGKMMTNELVKDICNDFYIVSGLAKGIDSVAHLSSINNKGKTIAVLGCGIDYCYPKENKDLYKRIKESHLMISEYPGVTEPNPDFFPMRNRLIAAFSKGVLVTDAKAKSGTLITVSSALELGREVMCLPHQANEGSQCNRLIYAGASLVETPSDIRFALK